MCTEEHTGGPPSSAPNSAQVTTHRATLRGVALKAVNANEIAEAQLGFISLQKCYNVFFLGGGRGELGHTHQFSKLTPGNVRDGPQLSHMQGQCLTPCSLSLLLICIQGTVRAETFENSVGWLPPCCAVTWLGDAGPWSCTLIGWDPGPDWATRNVSHYPFQAPRAEKAASV